jgi:hypothetical protein
MGFGAPTQWKIPVAVGLFVLWTFLESVVGLLTATLVVLALLVAIGVIWYLTRWR